MRELGEHSEALHAALAPAVLGAEVSCLILIGEEMRPLAEQVVGKVALDLASNVEEATDILLRTLHPGDAVLIKASNSVGLAKLVERVAAGVGERPCST
jgi:UDP-N-acetylmuramyl pentapeptide synthase